MAFATTAIRYGWVYLTALGVITGTTIYVVDNQRRHIKPEDIIQLPLAIAERCLATQTGTNSQGQPVYAVNPPSFVRTWKDTNGVSIVVTNTIGWHTDRAMMVSLDTTIQQLCPYYADTNSVYDGTTNIVMNTFTGLLVKLGIGNGTNFTRTPAAYTSNNVATYGDYPWQIYVEDLQERYKVLNALKMTYKNTSLVPGSGFYKRAETFASTYLDSKNACRSAFNAFPWTQNDSYSYLVYSRQIIIGGRWDLDCYRWKSTQTLNNVSTMSPCSIDVYAVVMPWSYDFHDFDNLGWTVNDPWYNPITYNFWKSLPESTNSIREVGEIGGGVFPFDLDGGDGTGTDYYTRSIESYYFRAYLNWSFSYCTNKYW